MQDGNGVDETMNAEYDATVALHSGAIMWCC